MIYRTIAATLCLLYAAGSYSEDIDKMSFNIHEYSGKVVYLDFWASWCGPCRETFPLMNELRAQYNEDELAIIAVNVDANREDADDFLQQLPATFPIVYDPNGVLAQKYSLKGMPSSYVFDRRGELVRAHVGFRMGDSNPIRESIKALISKTNPNVITNRK